MQDYYGTKRVTAFMAPHPETLEEGYKVIYPDGYKSWSPRAVFEAAYKPVTAMSFGHAIEAMKDGYRVARAGWNGKGMWIALSGLDGPRQVKAENFWSAHNAAYAETRPEKSAPVLPCFTMKNAQGAIVMGWLASQEDMLAEDWMIVMGEG